MSDAVIRSGEGGVKVTVPAGGVGVGVVVGVGVGVIEPVAVGVGVSVGVGVVVWVSAREILTEPGELIPGTPWPAGLPKLTGG